MATTIANGGTVFAGVIYGVRTWDDPEIRYVGMTTVSVGVRERQHFKAAASGAKKTPFYDWLTKHRDDAFAIPLAFVGTGFSDLAHAEQEWIVALRADGHRLLNLTEGGMGPNGHVWTSEQREAAGDRARGRKNTHPLYGPDNPMFGRHHSEQQRERWSRMRAGTNRGAENPNFGKFGPAHPGFGHTMSDESRAQLSEARKGELNPNYGKRATDETRAKMSAVRRGRPQPHSVRSAHTRHHTNKGVFSPGCRHCIDDNHHERDVP